MIPLRNAPPKTSHNFSSHKAQLNSVASKSLRRIYVGKALGRGLKDLTSAAPGALDALATGVKTLDSNSLEEVAKSGDSSKSLLGTTYPRVLVVTSGKGGTGKSFVSVNLACALAQRNQKVLLIDADFGLANAHLLLGLNPRYDISHLVSGRLPIQEILVSAPCGIKLLGGCSGICELSHLAFDQFCLFVTEALKIERDFDWILIDTSAGMSRQVMSFLTAAQEVLLVVNPESTSMLDAYAMMKTLFLRHPHVQVRFVANKVKDAAMAKEIYKKLSGAVGNYLKKTLVDTGYVVTDQAAGRSVSNRRPLILDEPHSHAAFCLGRIVQRILESEPKDGRLRQGSYFIALRREVLHWQNRLLARSMAYSV